MFLPSATAPAAPAPSLASGHSVHSNGLQAGSALPIFDQALAGDDRALVSPSAALASPSAALALMSMVRFQLTTAGKLLVGAVQPLVHLQRSVALRDLNAGVPVSTFGANAMFVQSSAFCHFGFDFNSFVANNRDCWIAAGCCLARTAHSELIAVLAQYTCDVQSAFLRTTEAELVFLPSFHFGSTLATADL